MSAKAAFIVLAVFPFLLGAFASVADFYPGKLSEKDVALLREEHDTASKQAKRLIPTNIKDTLAKSCCQYLKSKRFCHMPNIKKVCQFTCGCFNKISDKSCGMFKTDKKCPLMVIKNACRKTCVFCPWVVQPAKSCQEIKQKGHDHGDGLYWIDPNGGDHSDAFQVYCDMTRNGGGWTMCYTSNNLARPATETKYNPAHPYGKNGYRTDCNHIKFKAVVYVDEASKQTAYFSRDSNAIMTPAGNYGDKSKTFGRFTAHGVATTKYKYQLLICDTSFYRGYFVSGITGNCYKKCTSWCGDTVSPYFRTASSSASYKGVAFNANGHRPLAARLISVGIR